jgi:photosystem II stability/assembly factor-like uncharacterized protein
MDMNITVGGINVQAGYTGVISQGSSIVNIGSQHAVFAGGTFTGGTAAFSVSGDFTLSGTTFTSTSSNLNLAGAVNFSSGTFAHNNGSVYFNGAGSQTIPAWNYRNLNSTSTGARVLSTSGVIGISLNFSKGTNQYTVAGSTIEYNGPGAQTITGFNYHSLSISGARGSNNITFGTTDFIGISGSFNPTATFNSGFKYVVANSTINYNGSGAQTIVAFDYHTLMISGSRSASVTLAGSGTIGIEKVFCPLATFTSGDYIVAGSTVNYNSTLPQSIAPFKYHHLTSSSTGARSLSTVGTVTCLGTFTPGTNPYTNIGAAGDGLSVQTIGNMNDNLGIAAIDGNTCVVSGIGGLVYRTSNSGASWTTQNANTVADLYGLSFYDTNIGVCAGNSGTVRYTNDGGSTWNTPTSGVPAVNLRAVGYASANSVFVGGPSGVVIRSTNGGSTWSTMVTPGGLSTIYGFNFVNADTGYAVGFGGLIIKTTNGGSNWVSLSSGITDQLVAVKFISASTGVAVGVNGRILRTVNYGNTWTIISSGTTDALSGLVFLDSNNGFISGGNVTDNTARVLKTTDGGASWTPYTPGGTRMIMMSSANSSSAFIAGLDGFVTKYTCCTDGGTFDFAATSGSQAIPPMSFRNLTFSGAGTRVLSSTGTVTITGSFVTNSISTTVTGSTVNFAGGTQNIPAFTFNNLSISGSGDKTATGALVVNGILDVSVSRTLDMSTFTFSGTLTSNTGNGSLKTKQSSSTPIPTGKVWNINIELNGTTAQTLPLGTYNKNVTLSGTHAGDITFASGTINILGNFANTANFTSGTFLANGNTVNFSGTAQTIAAFPFNALTIAGSSTKTATGNLTVAGVLSISSVLDMGTNQLLGAISSTTGVGILRTQSTAAAPIPAGESWNFEVNYNGAAQSVSSGTYAKLTVNGTGNKNATGNVTVNGLLTITSPRIFDLVTNQLLGTVTSGGSGTLATQNLSSLPIPAGRTWTGIVVSYNASGTQTIVNGTYRDMSSSGGDRILHNTGTISITGTYTSGSGAFTYTGSTVNYSGNAQTFPGITYNHLTFSGSGIKTLSGAMTVSGNLLISAGTTLSPGVNPIQIKGNYNNNGTFSPGTSIVTFNGLSPQYITKSLGNEVFKSIAVRKPGTLYLNSPVEIIDSVVFDSGIVAAKGSSYILFRDGATHKNASDDGYIAGPVRKAGNDTFDFPSGDTNLFAAAFHPFGITAPGNVNDLYEVEYFGTGQTYGDTVDLDSLESVSQCEYWLLNRLAGTSNIIPSASWNTNSCNIYNNQDLLIAQWDGTRWLSLGKSGIDINSPRGEVDGLRWPTFPSTPITIGTPKPKKPVSECVLKKKLDATYYTLFNGYLKFKFDEEYVNNGNEIEFKIYDKARNVVISHTSTSVNLPIVYKDNRWALNLFFINPTLQPGFYVMEVKDRKGEISMLRFKI